MRGSVQIMVAALALATAGCGGGGETVGNEAAAAATNAGADAVANAAPALPPCPFTETGEWAASITGGELLVNGKVDLLMAGFKPTLTKRAAAPGTFAFDLALVPETGAAVNDRVRHEEAGVPSNRRAEIYCGGERIAAIDVVLVG